jgi:hypothetical protein
MYNIHKKELCPELGHPLQDRLKYTSSRVFNDNIRRQKKFKNSHEYRLYLTKNALSIMDHSFSIQKKKYSCKVAPFGDINVPKEDNKLEDPSMHNKCITQECKDAVHLAQSVNTGSSLTKDRLQDSERLPLTEAFRPLI